MTPKQESEMLMNAVLPVAERMLKEHGEFYPYGGCMMLDGSIMHIGASDSDTDYPKSRDLLFVLKDSFREMASRRECKAVALVFNVSITLPNADEKSDAIQLDPDQTHREPLRQPGGDCSPVLQSKDCRGRFRHVHHLHR